MRTDPSRYDRVEQHPEYRTAPDQPVLPADGGVSVAAIAGPMVLSLFGALFVLVAITFLLMFRMPFILSVIFVLGGLVFVFGGLGIARGFAALRDAPSERVVAVIVKERTDISSAMSTSTTSTTYYTTLQTRDGRRTEYRTDSSLAGRLVVDDIGVAYVKTTTFDFRVAQVEARTLVEFIRFDVD